MSLLHLSKTYSFTCQNSLLSCVLIICSTTVYHYSAANEEDEFQSRKNISLYYNFQAMLNKVYTDEFFERHQSHFLFIRYEKECIREEHKHSLNETRKPFIEVECNNVTARKMLVKTLANRIGAITLDDPAECLQDVQRAYEDEEHPLHGVFSTLSIYANAYQTTLRWYDTPVIVSGYWSQKVAYYINKAYENQLLPVEGSPVYDYPSDLIMPDVAFTVTYDNLPGVTEEYIRRIKEIMENINGPLSVKVPTCSTLDQMVDYIMYKMEELGEERDENSTDLQPDA